MRRSLAEPVILAIVLLCFLIAPLQAVPEQTTPADVASLSRMLGESARSVPDGVLEDHLKTALMVRQRAAEKLPDELWRDYVLDPRLGLGEITPWRGKLFERFADLLELSPRERALRLNRLLAEAVGEGSVPTPLAPPPDPLSMLKTGWATPCGRAALLVASLRTLNLPSRLVWSAPPAGGMPPCWVEVNLGGDWRVAFPAEPDRFGDPRPYLPGLPAHIYTLTPDGPREVTDRYGGSARVRILVASGSRLLATLSVFQFSTWGMQESGEDLTPIDNPYPDLNLPAETGWWETELTAPAHFYLLGAVPVTREDLMLVVEPVKTYPGTTPIYLMEALPPVEELPPAALLEVVAGDPAEAYLSLPDGTTTLAELARRSEEPLLAVVIDPDREEELEFAEVVGARALSLGIRSLLLTYPMGLAATTSIKVAEVTGRFRMERVVGEAAGLLPPDRQTPLVVLLDRQGRVVLASRGGGYPLDGLLTRGFELIRQQRAGSSTPNP